MQALAVTAEGSEPLGQSLRQVPPVQPTQCLRSWSGSCPAAQGLQVPPVPAELGPQASQPVRLGRTGSLPSWQAVQWSPARADTRPVGQTSQPERLARTWVPAWQMEQAASPEPVL